jgi:hypothetical protein
MRIMVIRFSEFRCLSFLSVLVLSALASACASHDMLYHNTEHSEGIANAGNRILLTNILAAAKRYPAYYSTITSYSGKQRFSAETSLKTPFGPDFINQIYEATTKLMGNNGLASVDLRNIGQEKGMKVLHDQLDRREYRRLLILGWPKELVETVLVHHIAIEPDLLEELKSNADRECKATQHWLKKHACAAKSRVEARCRRIPPKRNFHNRADDECEFLQFQAVSSLTLIAGAVLNLRVGEDDSVIKVEFPQGSVHKKFDELKTRLAKQKRAPYEMNLRSPAMIISYIGEIVAAQLFLDKPFVPTIDVPEDEASPIRPVRIFLLRRGIEEGAMKFSVTYEGATYSIPKRGYGHRPGHASYEILSYIKTQMDRATAASELSKLGPILVQ